nr:immunoglobulin heavy chain junction region [Macaca mulatta]MOV39547.1 immunoglobulin heavy chain junction region [Macaca mulatta]MOV40360.1 immunoglobulin heavy chain junction region [Macaca mulatta]MOV43782.1 immunoglobulin heavy chain junction region [Macaca mulatta]MOV44151.1 immunoglobulin heavy chain junction region [Macaca mulatta]
CARVPRSYFATNFDYW